MPRKILCYGEVLCFPLKMFSLLDKISSCCSMGETPWIHNKMEERGTYVSGHVLMTPGLHSIGALWKFYNDVFQSTFAKQSEMRRKVLSKIN